MHVCRWIVFQFLFDISDLCSSGEEHRAVSDGGTVVKNIKLSLHDYCSETINSNDFILLTKCENQISHLATNFNRKRRAVGMKRRLENRSIIFKI